jgi:hypothetical protein
VNTKQIRKLATVAATAALALQLFAGASSAAVPNGSAVGDSSGTWAGDGWAGFTADYHYADSSTLSKLYLEIDITNAAGVPYFTATKNDANVNGCATTVSSPTAVIKCTFKTVRNGDDFSITIGVQPAGAGDVVASGNWSSTGFVPGGNSSHGDAWEIADSATDDDTLVVAYDENPDHAAGFGNTSLTTQASNNKQSVKLTGLPSGKWASVDDNADADGFGFSVITLVVNGGQLEDFQVAITYPKNTQAPTSYLHISDGYSNTEYFQCQKGQTVNCFTWDKKTFTATLNLPHNGSLRRTS